MLLKIVFTSLRILKSPTLVIFHRKESSLSCRQRSTQISMIVNNYLELKAFDSWVEGLHVVGLDDADIATINFIVSFIREVFQKLKFIQVIKVFSVDMNIWQAWKVTSLFSKNDLVTNLKSILVASEPCSTAKWCLKTSDFDVIWTVLQAPGLRTNLDGEITRFSDTFGNSTNPDVCKGAIF